MWFNIFLGVSLLLGVHGLLRSIFFLFKKGRQGFSSKYNYQSYHNNDLDAYFRRHVTEYESSVSAMAEYLTLIIGVFLLYWLLR